MSARSRAAVLILLAVVCARGAAARTDNASCPLNGGTVRSLSENRDRLIADLARRKSVGACALWASLNKAERYIFLMDTAYLGDMTSRLFPPPSDVPDTALDHATALYSINGPKAGEGVDHSGRGGEDYNRIYLGFDAAAQCVMRDPSSANPSENLGYNRWQKSDDPGGPHKPFTGRDMIFWESWDLFNSLGPQFHFWRNDGDFDQAELDKRLGVCGATDRSLTELTIAFDFYHNSNPLGDYDGRGGFGWQIVDQHATVPADWDYRPAGCAPTPPVNEAVDGGGTFNGMGPVARGGSCVAAENDPAPPAPAAGPASAQLEKLAAPAADLTTW